MQLSNNHSNPVKLAHARLWNWIMMLQNGGRVGASALATRDFALDLIERAVVLILFLYFVNRMFPPLAGLVVTEIAHPELLWLAASTNFDAALLVISESLGVFLILTRRFATTVST